MIQQSGIKSRSLSRCLSLVPGSLFILGVCLTLHIWDQERVLTCAALQNRFDSEVEQIHTRLTGRFRAIEDLLRTSRDLFDTSPTLHQQAWKRSLETLALQRRYSGLLGLGFVSSKTFEMGGEPNRRRAAEKARDTGVAVQTEKVPLNPEGFSRPGFLLFLPVYRREAPTETRTQRRANLEGWLYAAISPKDLLKDIYRRYASDIHLEIFDGAPSTDKYLLFDGVPLVPINDGDSPMFAATLTPEVGGRLWTLRFLALPTFHMRLDRARSLRTLFQGAAISALLAALAWSLLTLRARAIKIAESMMESQRRSEDYFRHLIENSSDIITVLNVDGTIHYESPSVERVLGYPPEEVIGKVIFDYVHPEDKAESLEAFRERMLDPNKAQSTENRCRHKDGSWRHFESVSQYRVDPSGVPRLILNSRDITHRKELEKIAVQSEKMSAVGQLAAGIAHEINNPLGVILGFAQALLKHLPSGEALEQSLKTMEREAVRCKNLVQDLLTFSRVDKSEREPLDLNRAVEGALSLITAKAKMTQVEVRQDLVPHLPPILGNANQVQQIIINLANNALDAMKNQGTLTIQTETVQEGSITWVALKVVDTGGGIPPEFLPRIYEPFFTTKPIGQGTGLGLAMVHEIVSKHAGRIDVQSRPGFTEFIVKFPTHLAETPAASEAPQRVRAA